MPYYERKCPNCGATYVKGDTYCRTCRTPLEAEPESKETELGGIRVSDLHLFIDKNSSRYVEIFTKNKDKKVFFKLNWAAFFFNFYWMMYRKMYKYAAIFLAVNILFSLLLGALVITAFKPAIIDAAKNLEPKSQYSATDDFTYQNDDTDYSDYLKRTVEYKKTMRIIQGRMYFWVILPSLAFSLLFGFLADCIYRAYVFKKVNKSEGGTSVWVCIAGIVIYQIISNVITSPLLEYILLKVALL